jgi:hypothetical protein
MFINSLSFSRQRLQSRASPGFEVIRSARRSRALPVSQARVPLDLSTPILFSPTTGAGFVKARTSQLRPRNLAGLVAIKTPFGPLQSRPLEVGRHGTAVA